VLNTVQPLVTDLRKTELGQTLTKLEGALGAGQAMLYDAHRLFSSIGTTFTTPNGATVARREAPYLPVAAVQKTTDNFLSVSTVATACRVALKEEIARTTTALKNATTGAEVQKFGWPGRDRRLSRDYEQQATTGETMVYLAMIRLMLARLGKT